MSKFLTFDEIETDFTTNEAKENIAITPPPSPPHVDKGSLGVKGPMIVFFLRLKPLTNRSHFSTYLCCNEYERR